MAAFALFAESLVCSCFASVLSGLVELGSPGLCLDAKIIVGFGSYIRPLELVMLCMTSSRGLIYVCDPGSPASDCQHSNL
jgi:hypothetical protein